MDRAKVFKDYFISSQNTVLLPNEEFGRRKFLNLGINRSLSLSRIEELQQNHTATTTDGTMKSSNKQWIHPPDTLLRGHILYLVKFLGECEVDCPKGTDIVKDAIRKRKFNKTLRKTEGQRTPKVEISISVDGVKIQEPKTKLVKHEYPLHRISYCADDKSDKRMFTFIAKAADTNQHFCYVFASDKSAEEITLTIGQAFDLAYRRFLETQGKDMDLKKQQLLLKKRVETLESENSALKRRIQELERLKDREDIEQYKRNKQISDLTKVTTATAGTVVTLQNNTGESSTDDLEPTQGDFFFTIESLNLDSPTSEEEPSTPGKQTMMGRRLEHSVSSPQSNGTNGTPLSPGIISPPPPSTRHRKFCPGGVVPPPEPQDTPPQPAQTSIHEDLASVFNATAQTPQKQVFDPFNVQPAQGSTPTSTDAFGMSSFNPRDTPGGAEVDTTFSNDDKNFLDLQAGFSRGLSFGTEEFGMDDFDPLNQSN